ncbi:WIF domain [Trinorchestia longiramus]|nr:WIF domain [Trinorchestia longiramus]
MWVVCTALAAILLLLGSASATFDLYIDAKDFHKLLGVNSELWYVRDGEVKENALDYVVLVPPEVSVLTFHWRARHNILLPYKVQMHVANPEAAVATLSINATGSVPTSMRTFSLTLNCTNRLTTQVDVTLNLQVPLRASLHHLTNITIHRRKLCFRDPSLEGNSVGVSAVSVRGASAVVYAAVGCLALFLVAVAALAACTHRAHAAKLRRRRLRCGEAASDQLHSSSTTPCLPNNTSEQQGGLLPAHQQQGGLLQAYNVRPPHASSQHSYVAASSSTSSRRGAAAPPVLGWTFGGQGPTSDCGVRSAPSPAAQHVPYSMARQGGSGGWVFSSYTYSRVCSV